MSIVVKNLTKVYGEQHAVDNISFEAKPGEILGFLGPNGAGKSTTMKIATSYLPPSQGSVSVCGKDVVKEPMAVRKLVGYLPENNPLYLDMYVKEYLGFIASVHGISGKKAQQRIGEIIELVGLTKEQHKPIKALSKGYRQRAGVAQALLHNPEVLILDEPTTGLDPNQITEVREVIRSISQEKTVIFSTHIMQEVQALCDRVVIIHEGKLVANNSLAELGQQQLRKLRIAFAGEHQIEPFQALEGVEEIQPLGQQEGQSQYLLSTTKDCRVEVFQTATAHQMVLIELSEEKASLEQLFYDLTQGKPST